MSKLLDPMEKELLFCFDLFCFLNKQTDMEGGRQIRAELLQPGASDASVEREIFS